MDRPEGALTPAELDELLDKYGKVRVYMTYTSWVYFVKEPGPKYSVVFKDGFRANMNWNGVCHGMEHYKEYHVFVNYWHYYAYMLRQGKHAELAYFQ